MQCSCPWPRSDVKEAWREVPPATGAHLVCVATTDHKQTSRAHSCQSPSYTLSCLSDISAKSERPCMRKDHQDNITHATRCTSRLMCASGSPRPILYARHALDHVQREHPTVFIRKEYCGRWKRPRCLYSSGHIADFGHRAVVGHQDHVFSDVPEGDHLPARQNTQL